MNNYSTKSNSTCRPACSGWATVDIVTQEKRTKTKTRYYKSGTVRFRYRGFLGVWVNGSSHLPFCDEGQKNDTMYTLGMSFLEDRDLEFPSDTCICKCQAALRICENRMVSLERNVRNQLDQKLLLEVTKKEKEMTEEWRRRVGDNVIGSIVSTKSRSDSSIIAGVRSSHPTAINISIDRGPWRMYGGRNPEITTETTGSKTQKVRVEVALTYGEAINDGPPTCPSSTNSSRAVGATNFTKLIDL